MEWTSGGPASHFNKNGTVNRRAELKERIATVELGATVSRLEWLTMKSPETATAYALFEEEQSGRRWAAVVLSRVSGGTQLDYAILPEWTNPPHYDCGKRIMQRLTPLAPGECPDAEEWRRKCWDGIRRKKAPTSFELLPEGAQAIWTVGGDDLPFLPKGTKVKLVKKKEGRIWVWEDLASGALYDRRQVPEGDYKVLPL